MTTDVGLYSLNAGEISRLALARVDLAKLRIACEVERNFLPLALGPAMFRPGTAYVDEVPLSVAGWLGEFYYSETEKVLLVMTANTLNFIVNGEMVRRDTVTAAIVNGDFISDISGWTNNDEAGALSDWLAGGYMRLTGTGTQYAILDQQITVIEPAVEHGLRLVVTRGPVLLQAGVSMGGTEYLDEELLPGVYSLSLTPAGDFWIRLAARTEYPSLLHSISVEAPGLIGLPVPYGSKPEFDALRYDQSGDVLFVACRPPGAKGFQQRRIERRSSDSRSWGVALYLADDGPFRLGNVGNTTISPSGTAGSVTLTASRAIFKSGHAGAIYSLTHGTQTQTDTLGAASDASDPIRVSGLSTSATTQRLFQIIIDGTFVGTVTLQRSLAEPGAWSDVKDYTAPTTETYDDKLDNQIVYYRLEMSAWTSGSADVALLYAGGAQTGIVRITQVLSPTSATADVLQQLGFASATSDWAEGEWSDERGWPAAVAIHDGRLAWFQGIKAQLSVSDEFDSFDGAVTGDSGPINRTITTGGADGIRWALSLSRLITATAGQEISIRSSAFDEPLSPTAFTAKVCSTRGAAGVRSVRVNSSGIFVERDARRIFELVYNVDIGDYHSKELTRLNPEACANGVADIAVQMQPDTRIWCVLNDGTCAVLTYDLDDEVVAWTPVTTDGYFERVAVLPGNDEDEVYFIVRRVILGVDHRYVERLAKLSEARGGTLSKTVDSHLVYVGSPTQSIVAPYLAGKELAVWCDGAPLPVKVPLNVSGEGIIPIETSNFVAGLPYVGQIKTAKLAYAAEHGTALTMQKRVSRVGLVMADVSAPLPAVGRSFDTLTSLPATYRGKTTPDGNVFVDYDAVPASFNGGWGSDSRVHIQVVSPHCATVLGLAIHMATNESVEPPPAINMETNELVKPPPAPPRNR